MALGGGKFTTQNKKLAGTYINFISGAKATSSLSDRGVATLPLVLDWGIEDEVFTVTSEELQKNSLVLFGYELTDEKMKGIRDLFMNIKECHFYKLNKGVKASNTYAEAKFGGVRGNDLKIVIKKSLDDESKYDVITVLDTREVDVQTVATAGELVANDWVTFKATELAETASTPLANGTNGEAVTGTEYQNYLNKIEAYSFNAMGIPADDDEIGALAVAFTKRMRDEAGAKFQTVLYNYEGADYEGIVSVVNEVVDDNKAALVYWTTGIIAGCEVNKSNTNKTYDGEYTVVCPHTQSQLIEGIEKGQFIYHRVDNEIHVLEDINTLVTFTAEKGSDFANNQVIRVIDQIATDTAIIFNKQFLGKIPNDASGRTSLWAALVKNREQLETIRATENFDSKKLTVAQGNNKTSVVVSEEINVVCALTKLYLTVYVN